MGQARVEEIKRKIRELRDNWPAHGSSPALMDRMDDLEEELKCAQRAMRMDEEHAQDEDSH